MEQPREKTIDLGRQRCPFCHDSVDPETAVVCQDCLARHHTGCWDEGARCSSCGALDRLEPKGRVSLTKERAAQVLAAAGFPAEEVDAVLRSAPVEGDPFRQPRRRPTAAPFAIKLTEGGEIVITWAHHETGTLWLLRLFAVIILPLAFLMRTLWSSDGGQLLLTRDRLYAQGLFAAKAGMFGAPKSNHYTRGQPLRLVLSPHLPTQRVSLSFFDGDQHLFLNGPEGLRTGLKAEAGTWLLDVLLAWQRDDLDAWRPHLQADADAT